MGNVARLGVFCLMGLAIALSRLIEVELSPPEPIELRAEAPSAAATGDAQPAQPSQPQPAQPAQ
ncbi:MAG TPA: hypothetical protein DEA08_20805, partial [Planctomycetes bacterium]|nr:hypothetical protein [Planctomycetota bacterium]